MASTSGSKCATDPDRCDLEKIRSISDVADRIIMTLAHRPRHTSQSPSFSGREPALDGMCGGPRRVRDFKWFFRDIGDRADLFQIGIGQDRLAHFEPLGRGHALQVEPVRPPADDRDRLITSSSRIGSIGGLVTCAKFCLK